MFHSLRVRLFLVLIIVVMVAVGTVALLASQATIREFHRYIEHDGMLLHERSEGMLAMHFDRSQGWDGVQSLVAQMGQMSGDRVVLADAQGQIVADSGRVLVGQVVGYDWADPTASMTVGGEFIGVLYINPTGEPGSDAGEVFIDSMNRLLLLAVLAAGLVGVLLTWALSRRILGPVEVLTAAARKMEKGDLGQRVNVQSGDEIGELAHAFNAMADGLAHLEELRRNMVADVAHELRTPLTNIRGYLEAIQDGLTKPSPALIDSLYEEAMLLNRVVDDLQELSMAEAGQLKLVCRPVALAELVHSAVDAVQPRATANSLTVRADLPADLPPANADPARIGQVLRNLLNNALTYTPPDGEITIAARTVGSEVEVSVRDTGIGIAPDDLPYVFERFYRVDKSRTRATGGAGLGLAVVKQLVEAHGGRVGVESEVERGTTFTFTLPQTFRP